MDRPTTAIQDHLVQRVDERESGFNRGGRGDFGPRLEAEFKRFVPKHPLSGALVTMTGVMGHLVEGGKESLGLAKPLTKDLTVTLERKTEPLSRDDTNQVRMDYRLNRYLKIESQLGRRNSGADVFYNVDF